MKKYSIVIPVYNRPNEIDELLETLTRQTYQNFEVIVVEDGSTTTSEKVVEKYSDVLDVKYFYKENSGQGFTRNFGFEKASGAYFVIFDSDILVPTLYLETIDREITNRQLDAFGGPDREHPSFSAVQKAISYSMTSLLTTGGIRGGEKRLASFHPRSFNMGLSRSVFESCGGFAITRMAEDLEFSIRIIRAGYKVGLISQAFVYHKRRTSFSQFFKQLFFFGRGRIHIVRFYPDQLKPLHALPAAYVLAVVLLVATSFISPLLARILLFMFAFYFFAIFVDAFLKTKKLKVAFLSVIASFIQLSAYGLGFYFELFRFLRKK